MAGFRLVILSVSLVATAVVAAPVEPVDAARAISLADAASNHGVSGRYRMTVASTKKTENVTFLDSSADYRAADNLTFRIRPIVAKTLERRFGAAPEVYFKGKTVTVDGIVRRLPVYTAVGGRPRDLTRVAHAVDIDRAEQVVDVR